MSAPPAVAPIERELDSGTRRHAARPAALFIAGIALGVIGSAALAVAVIMPLAIAHRADLPFERLYGDVAVSLASRLNAGSAQNPFASDRRAVAAGREAYIGSCAQCHGATGDGKGVFGQATYPPATDLTSHDAQEKTDAQLFWTVKNGLSFTGMPGYGNQYDDTNIWALVSYIRALQQSGGPPPLAIATPTGPQLTFADISGSAEQRGAAIYFAQGCASCHGPVGDAPGDLGLGGRTRETEEAVHQGRRGMPAYDRHLISDADMTSLLAYLQTFSGETRRPGAGDRELRGGDRGEQRDRAGG